MSPRRPLRPCAHPGCAQLVERGRCERHAREHSQQQQRATDERRGSSSARGYGSAAWRALRADVLRVEPLCRECAKHGRIEPATCVDHIIPHRGDPYLFWERANLQPLCTSCHSTKTASEDGGFGNVRATDNAATG